MFQDGHACMDAEGRATQEAKAEQKPARVFLEKEIQ